MTLSKRVGLLFFAVASSALASHIVLRPSPDIQLSEVSFHYGDGVLNTAVDAFANDFTDSVGGELTLFPIDSGSFSLTAQIDSNGVASQGSFTVSGTISGDPNVLSSSGTLLTGDLSGFEFDETGLLMFTFTSLSGDLAGLFGNHGAIAIYLYSGFPGNFSGAFDSEDLFNTADVGAHSPEPGSWALMLVGASLLYWLRRRQSGSPACND